MTFLFTQYTENYSAYADGLRASHAAVKAIRVESFAYSDKIDSLIEYCESGVHATWVDADTEIHGIIDSFVAPEGHIFVGRGYDTYYISVSPCERSLNTLKSWRQEMERVRFDADALRPLRHLVTPVDTSALLCHHMANIKEGRVASIKRDGLKLVPSEQSDKRHAICKSCPKYQPISDKCGTCGCSSTMREASMSPWRKCPEDKWPEHQTASPTKPLT